MKKNIFKIALMLFGIGILDYGIITEIDGIGRFAILLFGTLFTVIACILPFKNNNKEKTKK